MQIVILLVMVAVFYAILIVPQQRRAKKKQELLNSIGEGEEVLTTSGIFGTVVELDGGIAFIDIGEGIELKIARDAIETVVRADDDEDGDEEADEAIENQGPIS
ncbi:MAG: preprotein translocase subunit YajC [Acidimicrobiales bacterium]